MGDNRLKRLLQLRAVSLHLVDEEDSGGQCLTKNIDSTNIACDHSLHKGPLHVTFVFLLLYICCVQATGRGCINTVCD